MAKPRAGEWIEDEFGGISKADIQQVVSLLEPAEAREVGLADEAELCRRHGMKFTPYPIPDRGLPSSTTSFLSFTKNLYHQIAGGENTVIHCRAGIGRTGIVAAGVLLHAAFEPEEAFTQISELRGVEVPDTDEQKSWLAERYSEIVTKNS